MLSKLGSYVDSITFNTHKLAYGRFKKIWIFKKSLFSRFKKIKNMLSKCIKMPEYSFKSNLFFPKKGRGSMTLILAYLPHPTLPCHMSATPCIMVVASHIVSAAPFIISPAPRIVSSAPHVMLATPLGVSAQLHNCVSRTVHDKNIRSMSS